MNELHEKLHDLESDHDDLRKKHAELNKAYLQLQHTADKENLSLTSRLNRMEEKMPSLSSAELTSAVRKPYHELGKAQKAVVHKQIREVIVPEFDNAMKKRKLSISQLVLDDTDGEKLSVKVNVKPPPTFHQLSPTELDRVAALSDSNSIHRTSHASYAAKRRIIPDLPPLSHLKKYNEGVMSKLPKLIDAPGRLGAFTPIRHELECQIEYLHEKGDLDVNEPIFVKYGIDGTRLTHKESVCIFTVETLSKQTEIGITGAVNGGDSNTDMKTGANPFFEQVKELDANPFVSTAVGNMRIIVRCGGDLSNIYAQLGLCKATARHCCPIGILPKDLFWKTAFDERLRNACNSKELGRTRANILNESKRSKPGYGVKSGPLTPLPRDYDELILKWYVMCHLHAIMREFGEYRSNRIKNTVGPRYNSPIGT